MFTGGNGAGKTSLLEAIYVLGRGRSFRAADTRVLVRGGAPGAELFGRTLTPAGPVGIGVGLASGGLACRVGGMTEATAADLAGALPVQALHTELGGLVPGPPEPRRRLLDWGVFHVEHAFLPEWRQFRRALQQRNAALRDGGASAVLDAWEAELARLAEAVDQHRRVYLDALTPIFRRLGADLVGAEVSLRYQRGWAADQDLAATLRDSRETDRSMGFTRAGPQRADLQFEMDDERSRWRASKGQQKLLASAFVLAQAEQVAAVLGRPVVLVVDEPAADLDGLRLTALLQAIGAAPAQVFMAAISPEGLGAQGWSSRFHVEHGEAKALL